MLLLPTLISILGLSLPLPPPATQSGVVWGPWYELRPIDHPPGAGSLDEVYAPERELRSMRPDEDGPKLDREFEGKGKTVITWQETEYRATEEDPLGDQVRIDFVRGLPAERADLAVAYLYRTIDAAQALELPVLLGSDDGARIWLNGEIVFDMAVPRGWKEAENRIRLPLRVGRNHLLVKVANAGGAWAFQLIHDQLRITELRHAAEERINAAIDRGVDYLLSTQYPDGSWKFMTNEYRNGATSLAVYTLLKSGISPRHDAVQRGLGFLRSRLPTKTYSASCEMMALAATKDLSLKPDMEAILELLIDWHTGGFAYPHGAIDLSNTQYAALGLRAAAHAGLQIRQKTWADLADHVLPYQTDDGGFSYHRGGGATGSMTAAGLTVLGACHEALNEEGAPSRRIKEIERALERGVDWLHRNWTVSTNPRAGGGGGARWHPYYLYGLERVGAFLRTSYLGPHDWYWDGSKRLVDSQGKDGQWATAYGEDVPNTCFALLFLERATATVSGVRQRTRAKSYGTTEPDALVSIHASGDTPLTVWISAFGKKTLADHGWPQGNGGGLRVKKVEYVVGQEVVHSVNGDPGRAGEGERFATKMSFPKIGTYTIFARVTLTKPPPESAEVVVTSPPLEVKIEDMVNEETISYASDSSRNLLLDARFDTRASTQFSGGWAARLAADGRMATSWLSANNDEVHTWTLELKKPVRADTLLVSQAWPHVREPKHAARFTRLEVIINKRRKKSILLDTTTDLFRKTEIPLGKPETIRFLEFRILDREKGEQHEKAVGFAEVELQLRK